MIVDVKTEIKSRITMADVCARYGFEVNQHGFICCPFHGENTPSLKIYPGARGFHCFGCGETGDVIAFVQKLFALPFRDAMRRINDDFGLNIQLDGAQKNQSDAERRRLEMIRAEQIRQQKAREDAERDYWAKFDHWKALCAQKEKYRPKSLNADLHPKFAEAVHLLPQAEIELEIAEGRRRQYGSASGDPAVSAG